MTLLSNKLPLFRSLSLLLLALTCLTVQVFGVESKGIVPFPQEYGKIVYRTDTGAPARIYIITNSHRSAFSGHNGNETLQSQVETYRIGEWLISQEQVDLLLPEGFFGSWEQKKVSTDSPGTLADNKALQQRLTDTSTFVNAEILLHEVYGIGLEQVEDRSIYQRTRELLHKRLNNNTLLTAADPEIEYLQQLRSTAILQKSIAVLKSTSYRGAMLTIGFSHLDDIITCLESGEIRPANQSNHGEFMSASYSDLPSSGIPLDISVIVPNALLTEPLLAMNQQY